MLVLVHSPSEEHQLTSRSVGGRLGGLSPVPSTGDMDIQQAQVPVKDIVCYLSLLEGGTPEDKLECEFISFNQNNSC